MTRSHFRPALAALMAVVIAAAAAGWWYRTSRPDYLLTRGRQCAQSGDFASAELYAAKLEAAGAEDHFHLLAGEIAWRQKAPARALPHLYRLKEEGPLRIDAAFLAGECLIALHMPRDAAQALQFVVNREPNHAEAHRLLGGIYYDQGIFTAAIRHLTRASQLAATDGRPLRQLGLIYRTMLHPEDAVPAYQESLRRDSDPPDREPICIELADCLVKLGRFDDALGTLDGLHSPEAVQLRVEALIAAGKQGDLETLLDKALAKAPGHPGLTRLRAERFLASGQPAEAALLLEPVVAAQPYDQRSRSQLARAYTAVGRSREAAEQEAKVRAIEEAAAHILELRREAEKDPWDAGVRTRLAETYEELGQTELARAWRQAAAACETRGPKPPL